MTEPTILVTNRIADVPKSQVPGVSVGRCLECRQDVWLSPSSVEFLESPEGIGARVRCSVCVMAEIAKDPTQDHPFGMIPTEKARQEVKDWIDKRRSDAE